MDKELVGWPYPKGCGQPLNVQREISNKRCPSGVGVVTGTNKDTNSGIEHTRSRFADDIKLSSAIEGRDDIQKDLDSLRSGQIRTS